MFSRLKTQFVFTAAMFAGSSFVTGALSSSGFSVLATVTFWLGLFGVTTATGVLSFLAIGRVTEALNRLRAAADSLASGKSLPAIGSDNVDEIVRVATALHDAKSAITAERLRLSEEIARFSTIMESMADGVLAVDHRYHILLANAACQQMLGLDSTEIVGRPLLEVARLRGVYDAVGQVLSRPGSLTIELSVGDKSPRHLLLRATQLPGDPCPGVVVVFHDVTEVRRLENIRKEFVANVSHELKTPLASIKAYAETLRMGAINDPENNVRFVERIEEDAKRLNGLIVDMLQIARIESHQQAFNIRAVDVRRQVEKCIRDMAARADAKSIRLEVTAPTDSIEVTADEEGLQTILANLVDNAIKYTSVGGQVSVRWQQEADSMILVVEDTGMGIEPNLQDRIFERFFRVDRARTRDAGGTGLGLSIVKHLVQAFHGSVSVQSQLGEGSRFMVRLPLVSRGKVIA